MSAAIDTPFSADDVIGLAFRGRAMASKRELAVSIDDDLFEWAALTAQRQGQGLSDDVAAVLSEQRAKDRAESLAILDEFFQGPGWPGVAETCPGATSFMIGLRCCGTTSRAPLPREAEHSTFIDRTD